MYPKNADVACMVMKSDTELFRENHLFNYSAFADHLEMICSRIGTDTVINDCFDFRDKRGNGYFLVCAIGAVDAVLVISRKINRKKKNPAFNWKGTVTMFVNAVHDLLRRLGRRG